MYTFHDSTQSTKTKNLYLPKRHIIGIKYQFKTTSVQKHIGQLPQDWCTIYDIAFEYKMHIVGSLLSINIIQTLVMFKKSNTTQTQFKEKKGVLLNVGQLPQEQCKSTIMGSLLFLTQESIKQNLSRAKRSKRKKNKEDMRELNQKKSLARNQRQF